MSSIGGRLIRVTSHSLRSGGLSGKSHQQSSRWSSACSSSVGHGPSPPVTKIQFHFGSLSLVPSILLCPRDGKSTKIYRLSCCRSLAITRQFTTTTSATDHQSTKAIPKFPWYSSSKPLARVEYEMLQNDRILKTMRGKAFRRLWQGATAYLLGLPLFQCAFGQSQWAEEIAENTAWAFTSGMGSLLSNTFRVPVDDIVTINDDTGDIELVFSHIINKSPQTQPASSDGQQHDQEDALASDEQIHDAFGKHFVKLYRDYRDNINTASCAANTNSELELTLQMIPMDYKVLKIGCLPFLSRNIIEEKPNFREEYFAMHKLVRTRGFRAFLDHWMDFANKTTDERGVFMETTVSADILVTCTEQFHVKEYVPNKDSPEATISTIQGDDKYRQVQHLVRMELDFHAEFDRDASHELREDDLRWVKGNWKIVDIDDRMDRIGEWLIPMPTRSSDSQR